MIALYTIKIGDVVHEIYRSYIDPKVEKTVFHNCLKDKTIGGIDEHGNYVLINLEGFSTIKRKKIDNEDLKNIDID